MALIQRTFGKHKTPSRAVKYIKNHFEGEYGGKWTVIVGNNFCTSVADDFDDFIHVQAGEANIYIFLSE